MEFLIAVGATIVGEIAKYTIVPIGRQLGYLCYYQRNIDNLNKKIQSLEETKNSIDGQLEEDKTRGREPTSDVEGWLIEVRREREAANEFLRNEDHGKAECGLFPNLWLQHKLSRQAQKTEQKIARVTENAGKLRDNISKISNLRYSFNNRDFQDFNSRRRTLEDIMEALKDPDHRIIGVYGYGGIGKTTLVCEVAELAQKEGLFGKVAIVTMSHTFEVRVKQKEIADQLKLEMPEEVESERKERLKVGLRNQKKTLIVLDDIWETEVPDLSKEIGIDFKDEQTDCKILLVSRDLFVLQNLMRCDKNIKLQFLTDHEAMNLFEKSVGGTIQPDFKSSATAIAAECGGLPIAIVTIACSLKNRDIHVWKATLRNLRSSPRKGYGKAYTIIKTSYDFIEDDQEREVLLLCSLHKEDENIGIDNLMRIHGAACDLFEDTDTLEDARVSVRNLVERLKERCLLLNGDSRGTVKMHDVIRDIMGSIALEDKRMYCFTNFPKFERFLQNREKLNESAAVSLLGHDQIDELPEEMACPKLQLLLLPPMYEAQRELRAQNRRSIRVPSESFKAVKELRALCLGSLILGSLPRSFKISKLYLSKIAC